MKIQMELEADTVSEIVARELIQQRQWMIEAMREESPMMFHTNPEEDRVEIQKHIDAMTLLMGFFATPNELTEWTVGTDES
jgi:hypothetical protein